MSMPKRPPTSSTTTLLPDPGLPMDADVRHWYYESIQVILQDEAWEPALIREILAEEAALLDNLHGNSLYEQMWCNPQGRHLPRLMAAYLDRFGLPFWGLNDCQYWIVWSHLLIWLQYMIHLKTTSKESW